MEDQCSNFGDGEKVQVVVRLRPLNRSELSRGDTSCVHILPPVNDTDIEKEKEAGAVNISVQKSVVESQQYQCSNCLPAGMIRNSDLHYLYY